MSNPSLNPDIQVELLTTTSTTRGRICQPYQAIVCVTIAGVLGLMMYQIGKNLDIF